MPNKNGNANVRKNPKIRSLEKKKPDANIRVRAPTQAVGVNRPNRAPLTQMRKKLSGEEAGIAQYLLGLSTPGAPCRVPVALGEFELDTNTYSYVFNGTLTTTAAGFGYVGACPDGWVESGNDGGPAMQYSAYTTGGYPVWYTPAGSAGTATIASGGASGANDAKLQLPKLDTGFVAGTRGRMTGIIMSIWADSPAQTTQGDVCFAVASSEQAIDDQVLNSATYASISALPQGYVSHVEMPLAQWSSDKQVHGFAVPFSENCFVFQSLPATGLATAGLFLAVAVVTGAAASQTLRFRIEYKYETTAPVTYMTGVQGVGELTPTTTAKLIPHLNAIRPMKLMHAPAAALPAAPLAAIKQVDESLFGRVVAAAKNSEFGKVATKAVSGAIKHIPFVGPALSSMFDGIFG